jgi:hypothetical protein
MALPTNTAITAPMTRPVAHGDKSIWAITVAAHSAVTKHGIKVARRVKGKALLSRRTTNMCPRRAGKNVRANIEPEAAPPIAPMITPPDMCGQEAPT